METDICQKWTETRKKVSVKIVPTKEVRLHKILIFRIMNAWVRAPAGSQKYHSIYFGFSYKSKLYLDKKELILIF